MCFSSKPLFASCVCLLVHCSFSCLCLVCDCSLNFGTLQIDWSASPIAVTFQARGIDGQPKLTRTVPVSGAGSQTITSEQTQTRCPAEPWRPWLPAVVVKSVFSVIGQRRRSIMTIAALSLLIWYRKRLVRVCTGKPERTERQTEGQRRSRFRFAERWLAAVGLDLSRSRRKRHAKKEKLSGDETELSEIANGHSPRSNGHSNGSSHSHNGSRANSPRNVHSEQSEETQRLLADFDRESLSHTSLNGSGKRSVVVPRDR